MSDHQRRTSAENNWRYMSPMSKMSHRYSEGHLFMVVDQNGRMQSTTGNPVILRKGEIGVLFCLPIIGAPSARLRDIDLRHGEFARIHCGLTTVDVFCESRQAGIPTQTRTLLPGQFVVITCSITR